VHLQKDSPCIDTGNPHAWVAAGSIDIDGDARIIGRGIDIGADEYSPVAMVTKPAGGEVWAAGSLQEICWKSDVVGSAHIMLSRDGGAAWVVIATVDAGEGRYFWEVPNGNSERCVLKVVPSTPDGDVIVYESGIFAIHQDNMPRNRIDSAWSTLGQDFDRAGTSEINGPLTGCVKWRFDTDGAVVSSITAGFNRRVHIACENGMLYTLTKNGDAVWEFDANSPLVSAPTVGTDGSVYVGDEEGRIYAIARNGKLRWTFDTGGPVYSAPAVSNDGQIYVCSADGTMRALGSEGTELWLARTGTLDGTDGVIMASPAIGADGTIYVGGVYDANLYAFNPDGSRKWACNFAWGDGGGVRGRPIASPVVGADGTIYQTLVYDPNLYAVNPEDGSIKWASRMTPYCEWVEENGLFPPDLSEYCDDWYGIDPNEWFYYGTGYSSPAVGPDGTVYISFDDPYLRAVDPNGAIRWVTQLGEAAGFDLAVDRDGYIYAACEDGQLYVVSPDGTPMSMFEADEWLGYPVIAEDGTVIVSGSRDNTTIAEPALNSVWALSRDGCVDGELDLDLIADVNGDGIIDSADLLVIADDWLGKDKEEKKADKGQAVGRRGRLTRGK
jgi:outer membrane protein assembly factor BamB